MSDSTASADGVSALCVNCKLFHGFFTFLFLILYSKKKSGSLKAAQPTRTLAHCVEVYRHLIAGCVCCKAKSGFFYAKFLRVKALRHYCDVQKALGVKMRKYTPCSILLKSHKIYICHPIFFLHGKTCTNSSPLHSI